MDDLFDSKGERIYLIGDKLYYLVTGQLYDSNNTPIYLHNDGKVYYHNQSGQSGGYKKYSQKSTKKKLSKKSPNIHVGPRGGKYIMKGGKKIYL